MADHAPTTVFRRSRGSIRREKARLAKVPASVDRGLGMPKGRPEPGTPLIAADPAPESASEATRHRAGVRLADLMSDSRRGSDDARPTQGEQQGGLDVSKTHLTKGVTPQRALSLIDSLPLPDEGEAWRSRERVRAIVVHLPADQQWRVQIYVRLDHQPPAAPLELYPPRLCVLAYRPGSRQLGFVMLLTSAARITFCHRACS
eukprot:4143489-Prymnesium_polylepis.1